VERGTHFGPARGVIVKAAIVVGLTMELNKPEGKCCKEPRHGNQCHPSQSRAGLSHADRNPQGTA
jgi:hypothetical protein